MSVPGWGVAVGAGAIGGSWSRVAAVGVAGVVVGGGEGGGELGGGGAGGGCGCSPVGDGSVGWAGGTRSSSPGKIRFGLVSWPPLGCGFPLLRAKISGHRAPSPSSRCAIRHIESYTPLRGSRTTVVAGVIAVSTEDIRESAARTGMGWLASRNSAPFATESSRPAVATAGAASETGGFGRAELGPRLRLPARDSTIAPMRTAATVWTGPPDGTSGHRAPRAASRAQRATSMTNATQVIQHRHANTSSRNAVVIGLSSTAATSSAVGT
jgi:hypothetical protein